MIGAHGVFHAVLSGGGGQLHGDARHRAAVGDMLTGLKIVPVPDRAGQVTGNMADGRQRDGFAEDVYPLRHHDLRVVEQCIKPLIGRIGRRHGSHQLGIDDRQHGDEPRITEPDFFLGFRIGDDPQQLISEPVPDVVAMVTTGRPALASGRPLPVPPCT